MSHFSVLVIGDDVEAQLQPFHEFECTGTEDQYVKDIDVTEKYRASFDKDTTECLRDPDGNLHRFFDDSGEWRDEFSMPDPKAPPYDKKRRIKYAPPGYEQITVPTSSVESFATWVEGYGGQRPIPFGDKPDLTETHKYGYALLDEAGQVIQVIDRTNPNKKWDCYQIGGRWSGFFKLKSGATGVRGKAGVMGASLSDEPDRADVLTKGDIDFAAMRNHAGKEAETAWDWAATLHKGERWQPWSVVRDRCANIEQARTEYHAQPALAAMKADPKFSNRFWDGLDDFLAPREQFVSDARATSCCTYALLYKGEWSARGEMGWFGCSNDKIDDADWRRLFNELLDGLPADTKLTVVDCHI